MQAVIAVTVPFFALVLCGYLAARRGLLAESAIPGLNTFVLFFALPCMLFRFGQNTPILEMLNPAVLTVYLLSALAIVGATLTPNLLSTSMPATNEITTAARYRNTRPNVSARLTASRSSMRLGRGRNSDAASQRSSLFKSDRSRCDARARP